MISKKKGISIAIIIVIAAMFVSSSAIVNPLLAKSGHSKEKTNSPQKGYKEFQKCLTGAVGTKGYATKLEIRDCFNPIYSLSNSNQSNSTQSNSNLSGIESSQTNPSNSNPSNSNPSGIDFSSPQSMNH